VGFDWLRNWGAFLWYRFACDRPVASVFRAFQHFVARSGSHINDFRFNLLRVFSEPSLPAHQILDPESYSANPLNWRLAYMTRFALAHLPQRADEQRRIVLPLCSDPASGSRLSFRFADQLEQMGLWHWAVYVLLIEPALLLPGKQRAIGDVLLRSCALPAREEGETFVKELNVLWLTDLLRSARDLYETSTSSPPSATAKAEPISDYAAVEKYLRKYY
jgi:hypothetical protein